jgi:hypothetical protein
MNIRGAKMTDQFIEVIYYDPIKILQNKIGHVNPNLPDTMPALEKDQTLIALIDNYRHFVATPVLVPEVYNRIYNVYTIDGYYKSVQLVTVPTSCLEACPDGGKQYGMKDLEKLMS